MCRLLDRCPDNLVESYCARYAVETLVDQEARARERAKVHLKQIYKAGKPFRVAWHDRFYAAGEDLRRTYDGLLPTKITPTVLASPLEHVGRRKAGGNKSETEDEDVEMPDGVTFVGLSAEEIWERLEAQEKYMLDRGCPPALLGHYDGMYWSGNDPWDADDDDDW